MNVNWTVDQPMDPAIVMGCNAGVSLRIKKRVAVIVDFCTPGSADGAIFRPAFLEMGAAS